MALQERLHEVEEDNQRHIAEKAALEQKLQRARVQVQKTMARNLQLEDELEEAQSQLNSSEEQTEGQLEQQGDEIERLETENRRLNEFVTLHMDDAAELRDKVVVFRDMLSDQQDENQGLREFVSILQTELLQCSQKGFERAVNAYSNYQISH